MEVPFQAAKDGATSSIKVHANTLQNLFVRIFLSIKTNLVFMTGLNIDLFPTILKAF
jgi:hypothetical protein